MKHEVYEDERYQKNGELSIHGFLNLTAKIGEEEAIALIQQARMIRLQIDQGKTGGGLVENTPIFIASIDIYR